MKVGPTSGHLMELRERLYDEVREYTDDKHLALVPDGMSLAHSETLEFTLSLAEPQDRANLLAMTPHGWRASAERRSRRPSRCRSRCRCVTIISCFND